MRASWLGERQESLGRRLALLPLLPAAWAYGAGARLHRGLYRSGLRRQERPSYRVVSVGNLVVGGAGMLATWGARWTWAVSEGAGGVSKGQREVVVGVGLVLLEVPCEAEI